MTGLDVEKEVIIEVAAIVTNVKLETLDQYHTVVKQPQQYIDSMDAWNKKHHNESGLVGLIPGGKDPEEVENDLLNLIEKHYKKNDQVILAGNSIFQDRIFIEKYFKNLSKRLHYRMLDVSAFKVVFSNFYQISHTKPKSKHRATDDILQSINELQKYLSYIKI